VGIQVSVAQSTLVQLPALASRLRVAQPDPFTPDIVVVPSVGQRDWLLEQLGALLVPEHGGAGICTNVEFWFPADFNRRIVATGAVVNDPWDPQQLGWTILGLLDSQAAAAPRCPISTAGPSRPSRRITSTVAASRNADLSTGSPPTKAPDQASGLPKPCMRRDHWMPTIMPLIRGNR
jgi:exodeoxyribonuclease V gamma subunit